MELADEEDVGLVGVTAADRPTVEAYVQDYGWEFPILAGAGAAQADWGVRLVWGNVVKLVDPAGRVVAEGLGAARRVLQARP